MLKRKNKIQSAGVFVALFPAGAISVLHTFGFWVCPVHISSFHPVSKCFYAFLRAWSCHTPCWLLGWIVEAGNLSGWMWEASVKSQSKAIKGGGKWSWGSLCSTWLSGFRWNWCLEEQSERCEKLEVGARHGVKTQRDSGSSYLKAKGA